MANRYMTRNYQTLEKAPIGLFVKVTFGATGAPTLTWGKGIKSVTRTGAGAYDIDLQDTYKKLLAASHTFINATAPASPTMYIVTENSANQTTPKVSVQFMSIGTTPAATDPASGEAVLIKFDLSNTDAI